uniref:Uncharacterized protein n=1 Tax=Steinernema glaseri TaxID=37863 RepID=A0A1I7Y4X4_9BILA
MGRVYPIQGHIDNQHTKEDISNDGDVTKKLYVLEDKWRSKENSAIGHKDHSYRQTERSRLALKYFSGVQRHSKEAPTSLWSCLFDRCSDWTMILQNQRYQKLLHLHDDAGDLLLGVDDDDLVQGGEALTVHRGAELDVLDDVERRTNGEGDEGREHKEDTETSHAFQMLRLQSFRNEQFYRSSILLWLVFFRDITDTLLDGGVL